jgi:hypothetical protein
MASRARLRVINHPPPPADHPGSCSPPTPCPPRRTTPPTPRPRPRSALPPIAPRRLGPTGLPRPSRLLPRPPLLPFGPPRGLPRPAPRCRPLLPPGRRPLAGRTHRPRMGPLLAQRRRRRQGPPPTARGGADPAHPPQRPASPGSCPGPLALERPPPQGRRWHYPVYGRHRCQPESLSPAQRPEGRRRLAHRPSGGAVLPGGWTSCVVCRRRGCARRCGRTCWRTTCCGG